MTTDIHATVREVETTIASLRQCSDSWIPSFAPHVRSLSFNLGKLANELDEQTDRSMSTYLDVGPAAECGSESFMTGLSAPSLSSMRTPTSIAEDWLLERAHPMSSPSPAKDSHTPNFQAAFKTLDLAFSSMTRLQEAIQTIETQAVHWLNQDHRIAHLQPLSYLQTKASGRVRAHDRILLVLAGLSIAEDFRAFEENNGWVPKEDKLVEAIQRGDAPQIQKMANHVDNFVASMSGIDTEKLKTGLNFGMRLLVIMNICSCPEIAEGLALLLGFECNQLLRLSYRNFGTLKYLMENEPRFADRRAHARHLSGWFRDQRRKYNELYRSLQDRRVSTIDSVFPFQEYASGPLVGGKALTPRTIIGARSNQLLLDGRQTKPAQLKVNSTDD